MQFYFLVLFLVPFAQSDGDKGTVVNNDVSAVTNKDATCSSACEGSCINLNYANRTSLDANIDYVSWDVAKEIISYRPVCNKKFLVGRIHGLNIERVNGRTWECVFAECNKHYNEGNWKYSPFTECSAKCDRKKTHGPPVLGIRTRTATCQDPNGKEAPTIVCREADLETLSRTCNEECVIYSFLEDDWGACSMASEGECTRTRSVECVGTDINGDTTSVGDFKCEGDKPAVVEKCQCNEETAIGADAAKQTSVDMNKAWNMQNSHTQKYQPSSPGNALIVRRGADIQFKVRGSKPVMKSDIKLVVDLDMSGTRKAGCEDTEGWDDQDPDYGPYGCKEYRKYKWCRDETTKCGTASGWGENWKGDPKSWGALDNCCHSCECLGGSTGGSIDWDSYWTYRPDDKDNTKGIIQLSLPANNAIGRFDLLITIHDEKMPLLDLFVLYNPWNSQDETHMVSVNDRNEYLDNTDGLIWVGSSRSNFPFRWRHYQHIFSNLEVVMNSLRRLTYEYLSNIVIVARHISYAVGQDICWGRWASDDKDYQRAPSSGYDCEGGDCHSPGYWSNTTELFEVHKKYNKRVQFCQCFVYGGVVTSVGRALGLPSRTVTNFQSAHDYGKNRAIEFFVKYNPVRGTISRGVEEPPDSIGKDSVWNFHVWNEVWFNRDLRDGVGCSGNGWQIIDATPQEVSTGGNPACDSHTGCYQCGPAAQVCVKENVDVSYDSEFVITEVNAAVNMWQKTNKDPVYKMDTEYKKHPWGEDETVGQQISTKSTGKISASCLDWSTSTNCKTDLNDITWDYKYKEPSSPWKGVTDQADRVKPGTVWSDDIGRRYLSATNNQTQDDFLKAEWIPPPKILLADNEVSTILFYGDDYSRVDATFRLASFEDDPITINYVFEAWVQAYNGDHKSLIEEKTGSVLLGPGKEDYLKYSLLFDSWKQHLAFDVWTLTIEAELTVNYHDMFLNDVEKFYSADVLICDPQRFMDDRVLCKNRAIWKKHLYTLEYECEEAPSKSKLGDGRCDAENNFDPCFDGGDCCESTCSMCPSDPSGDCLDRRTPDFSLNECDDVEAFAQIMNRTSCDLNTCDSLHESCLDDMLALKAHFGSLDACLEDSGDMLSEDATTTLKKMQDCTTKHNETWTPSDEDYSCPQGLNDVIVHVQSGSFGPDVKWSVTGAEGCNGGPYPPNHQEYLSCCVPDNAKVECLDSDTGWAGAYIEVKGKKYCEGLEAGTADSGWKDGSTLEPLDLQGETDNSDKGNMMETVLLGAGIVLGVLLVLFIGFTFCKAKPNGANRPLLNPRNP